MFVYVARQPIFDASFEVIAYELLYRDSKANIYNQHLTDTVATSILLLNSYLSVGMNLLTDNKKGFINFGPQLIMEDIPELLSNERIIIELLESVVPDKALIKKLTHLKKAGYTIALDDYIYGYPYTEFIEIADIIKVDFIANNRNNIRKICTQLKPYNKILLAEKIETLEEFQWAKSLGFEFFQGFFFSKPIIIESKKLTGTTYNFMTILKELDQPLPDYKKISTIIETDVIMTFKILTLVNSSYALVDNVSSIQHAISILGIDAFTKWFTLATIHQLGNNKPHELVKLAMIRMKFLENVGEFSVFKQHVHPLRLIGLLSVIDALTGSSLDKVLQQLPLSKNIKDTLLGKETLYSTIYLLILNYEKGNFTQANALSTVINLDFTRFPDLYQDAIEWTDKLFDYLESIHPEKKE